MDFFPDIFSALYFVSLCLSYCSRGAETVWDLTLTLDSPLGVISLFMYHQWSPMVILHFFFSMRMILLQSLRHFILLLFLLDKKKGRRRCEHMVEDRCNKFTLDVWGQFHGLVGHSHGWIQRRDKEYDRVRTTPRDLRSCLRSAKEPGVSGNAIMKINMKSCYCRICWDAVPLHI